MRKPITFLLFMFLSLGALLAQNPCSKMLDNSQKRISTAYSTIKNFRDTINFYEDKKIKDYKNVYAQLYSRLKKGGSKIQTEKFLLSYFSNQSQKIQLKAKKINALASDSVRFIESFLLLDSTANPYELRIFEVQFDTIACSENLEIYNLMLAYNKQLRSVGRRMGRLIQSAILEDEDYVTPNSLSRLDMAMMELRMVEYQLKDAILRANTPQKTVKDTIYVFCKEPEFDLSRQYYISAVIDLENSFGIGLYSPAKVDFGIDLLFNPSSEGDVIVHPKIGAGRGMFHFALGGYYQIVANELEFTANVYVLNKRVLGGLSFNPERILLSIGYAF